MARSKQELAAEFAVRLAILTDSYTRAIRQLSKMDPDGLKVLMLVRAQQSCEMTFESVGKALELKDYQVTRIFGRLEKSGLVTVHAKPDDKRGRILRASAAGVEMANQIAQKVVDKIVRSGLTKSEIEELCEKAKAVQGDIHRWRESLGPDFYPLWPI